MSKWSLTASIAFACIFWGTAVLTHRHHLGALTPELGTFLLAYGIGLMVILVIMPRRPR
ncbi:MAG TPA: hypothetical protein VKU77_26595 [Streptosporangiaceae bacterium]|nr:hypothetical protein [Streptosporangiaceae bacterium]